MLPLALLPQRWSPALRWGGRRLSRRSGRRARRACGRPLRAAAQCCAVEGAYPHTLRHLEEHYGLTVNHDDYAITYEAFASNVVPSVVVVPR